MMYKDKDKQREATREAVRRHRAKGKDVTDKAVTVSAPVGPPSDFKQGITSEGITTDDTVIPDPLKYTFPYSPDRWFLLQSHGYEMPDGDYDGQMNLEGELPEGFVMGYARKLVGLGNYQFAVPVPGDPSY